REGRQAGDWRNRHTSTDPSPSRPSNVQARYAPATSHRSGAASGPAPPNGATARPAGATSRRPSSYPLGPGRYTTSGPSLVRDLANRQFPGTASRWPVAGSTSTGPSTMVAAASISPFTAYTSAIGCRHTSSPAARSTPHASAPAIKHTMGPQATGQLSGSGMTGIGSRHRSLRSAAPYPDVTAPGQPPEFTISTSGSAMTEDHWPNSPTLVRARTAPVPRSHTSVPPSMPVTAIQPGDVDSPMNPYRQGWAFGRAQVLPAGMVRVHSVRPEARSTALTRCASCHALNAGR